MQRKKKLLSEVDYIQYQSAYFPRTAGRKIGMQFTTRPATCMKILEDFVRRILHKFPCTGKRRGSRTAAAERGGGEESSRPV